MDRKRTLELDIADLIRQFTDETGFEINKIEVTTITSHTKCGTVSKLQVDVQTKQEKEIY